MALGSHVQRVSMGSAMPGSKGYLSLQWDSHHGAHATIWAQTGAAKCQGKQGEVQSSESHHGVGDTKVSPQSGTSYSDLQTSLQISNIRLETGSHISFAFASLLGQQFLSAQLQAITKALLPHRFGRTSDTLRAIQNLQHSKENHPCIEVQLQSYSPKVS